MRNCQNFAFSKKTSNDTGQVIMNGSKTGEEILRE